MSFEEDREEPASVIVTSMSGAGYDVKNIPGFLRKKLIDSGDITIDSFVQADNMPGAKLQKLRNNFRANNNMAPGAKAATIDINTLEVGSLVEYKKTATEVRKVNVEKELVNIKFGGKIVWVNVAKLKAVDIPPVDEE